MTRITSALAILILLMLYGCTKVPEPVQVAAWERYQDPYFKVSFTYPKGWYVVPEGGKVSLYSSQEAVQKFLDPTMQGGKTEIQLVVAYEKPETQKTLDQYVSGFKDDRTAEGYTVGPATPGTIDGLQRMMVEYSGRVDENTTIKAIRAFTVKDSVLYYAHYAAFNESFEPNRFVFDTLITSIHLHDLKPAAAGASTAPAAEFTRYSNNFLEISYPNNFETGFPTPKGGALFSLELKGYREDCTIRIDVLPAKGLGVEKVFAQNLKFYRPRSRSSTTIDGSKAMYLNDSPARSIDRRVYFLAKNDKVYRMIFTYYQPLKKDYLPAFERTIASVRVK